MGEALMKAHVGDTVKGRTTCETMQFNILEIVGKGARPLSSSLDFATLAQLVEQRLCKPQVVGSSPTRGCAVRHPRSRTAHLMSVPEITSVIGRIPYRMAFAGGWIDQPFVSRLNPDKVGSMVVVAIEPNVRFMDRCGMATGTRKVALRMWKDGLPDQPPAQLVKELYAEEN